MKTTLLTMAVAVLASALLAACGGGTQAPPGSAPVAEAPPGTPPVAEVPPSAPAASVKRFQLEEVKPAEVVILSLQDLDLPADADSVTPSGAISNALLMDGTLRFSTPGDTGEDQEATLEIKSGAATTISHVLIRSQRLTAAQAYDDGPEEDGLPVPESPRLTVDGLGPNNTITDAPLTFRLQGVGALDLKDDSKGLIIGANNVRVRLKDFWSFNPVDSSFSISGPAMQRLLSALPNGALTIGLNFVSKDGEFAASYDMLAIRRGAKVSGRLQSLNGDSVTMFAGRKILLKGYNEQMRAEAVVDANGTFTFENVIPDTYFLTWNDLRNPYIVSGSMAIFKNTTQASVTLVVPPNMLEANTSSAKLAAQRAGAGTPLSYVSGYVTQDGTPPPPRDIGTTEITPSARSATRAADGASATFSATSNGLGQDVITNINFTVPVGTKSVGVKMTVFTDEYPQYTRQQSIYNDTWAYSVVGLPATGLSANGSVNHSHYTQGRTSKTVCVDVTEQTRNAALTVSGFVHAINIGDYLLPTTTTVELTLACKGLSVSSARFLSPNANAHPILNPIRTGANLPGPYLSIQQSDALPFGPYRLIQRSGSGASHTIPLEITYKPADAKITEVHIGISPDGGDPAFAADNLLGQAHTTDTPGKIKFPRLSLPTFAGSMVNGMLAVTVRITGTVGDTPAISSDPAEGGKVEFDGATAFTPLYLAADVASLSGRRYGSRDAGGDSWATQRTINWLSNKPYRFDDISGKHVTQTANGRSILGHEGHSDGQQIDMRYADGRGGFGDALGGQGNGAQIKKLIDDAAAEVAGNAVQKPKLSALQAWIAANRALLDREAAHASTRVIYIGDAFIKLALVDAKFPPGASAASTPIPGVTAWTPPENVHPVPRHLSHWHISISAHP
ncbi:hypothetical protein [Verminephrobacter eiseniae]|uniref:hypothetical protein n=1 Tax=Verminephrobacter eiseniae TaxID=364317 RepID=UPI0022375941|nr:hypothetical protein [Verminephrobacter eiseniae]